MSYNTYNNILESTNTQCREELAPGGPVSFWRSNRGHNNGMNNQYRHNQSQLRQEMHQSLHSPAPLMRLRQPAFQGPMLHRTPKEEQASVLEEMEQPKLQQPSPSEEQIPPMEKLRQPSPLQWQSPEQRQPSPERRTVPPQPSPPRCTEFIQEVLEEKMKTENCDSVKTSLDNGNIDCTTSNLVGAKVKKKLSKREWRRRQNMHLRRILMPKNALIVLNEMLPGEKGVGQFKVEPAPQHPSSGAPDAHSFCAELTVDGVSYKGYGPSKLAARTDAAEQVFRDIVLKHMGKLQRQSGASSDKVERHEDGEGEGTGEEEQALPMIQLASFALHKLFAEWECGGHKVPQLKALAAPPASEEGEECAPSETVPRPARPPRPLPVQAAAMHPCMLLTHMRPDLHYRRLSADSSHFTVAVDVDGRTYVGSGPNKREARREAARAACAEHFGVQFAVGAGGAGGQ